VSVLCQNQGNALPEHDEYDGIEVWRHNVRANNEKLWLVGPALEGMYLKRIIGNYFNGEELTYSLHYLYAYATKKAFPKKRVIFVVPAIAPREIGLNFRAFNKKTNIYKKILVSQYFRIEKKAIETADKLVVLSQMRRKEVSDYYKISQERINVISPGVDLEKFKKRPRNNSLLESLNIPLDGKIILSICRLDHHKNIDMLIRSFLMLQSINTFLIIVGRGPELFNLEQLVKESKQEKRIRIVGFQENLADYYSIADLFVLPSVYEGFGFVFLEAMASGIPCIGLKSDYPKVIVANEEVIKDSESGFLVDPYSKEGLAEKIDIILNDKNLRERMGSNARSTCEQNYKWDEHSKKLLKLGLND
jgi:glycosyltransferase involved in cell wall biosynthesis